MITFLLDNLNRKRKDLIGKSYLKIEILHITFYMSPFTIKRYECLNRRLHPYFIYQVHLRYEIKIKRKFID